MLDPLLCFAFQKLHCIKGMSRHKRNCIYVKGLSDASNGILNHTFSGLNRYTNTTNSLLESIDSYSSHNRINIR